nr:hypothetical protein [Tanacetum cinerariifolium]
MTAIELSQVTIKSEVSSLRQYTSDIKSIMTRIYQSFKGQFSAQSRSVSHTTLAITKGQQMLGENVTHADTEEPLSYTEGEHAAMKEEPTNAVPIKTVKPTKIPTPKVQPITTIISISQPEPFVPQREGKAIVIDDQPKVQRKLLTEEQIQAHMDKKEKIKKSAKEAKMLEMTKTEVIKVVQKEAKKIRLDPKTIIIAKAGEKFKKVQDAEHQVLKREHS